MIGIPLPGVPIRAIVGNLLWSHDGTVWAVWRVDPVAYRYADDVDKVSYGRMVASMLRSLRGEPLLLSLCGRVDTDDELGPRERRTGYRSALHHEITDGYLRLLDEYDLRERTYWLVVPLPHASGWASASAITAAATTAVARAFGLTPGLPGAAEVRQRVEQATRMRRGAAGLTPATADEIVWIHRRAARRGTPTEPTLASARRAAYAEACLRGNRLRSPSFASLGQVHLVEGASVGSGRHHPFAHRYLTVTTADGGTCYQAFLALADLPESWRFPGGEWLASLHEDVGFPVDWAVRATVNPGGHARAQVTRKRRQLSDQVGEFTAADNEAPTDVDALPTWVSTGHRQLAEEQAALEGHSAEVEYEATVVLGVWGATVDECEEKAELLRTTFSDELVAVRPTGDQLSCYAAMLAGVTAPRVVADYRQYLLAGDLAKAMPFVGGRLGDRTGQVLGLSADSGTVAPVRLHLADWTRRDISASLGLFAELGAGKSVTLKKILADVGAEGGRTVGWDRTRTREQATFLSTVFGADRVQVVDLADPRSVSLDPLRVLPADTAAAAAETFLTQLLGVETSSEAGTLLAEAIDKTVRGGRPSMAALVELLAGVDQAPAAQLGRQLRAAVRRPGTAVVFDPALPPLGLATDHIVFATHGLAMPRAHELRSDRHLAQLPFPALFGRAVLTLTAALARSVAFEGARFVLVHADECYWLTREGEGSPGYDTALELIRDGRKNNAGLLLAGHDPDDAGDETLLGLLSAILLGRQRNRQLATGYVAALGVTDPDLAERLITTVTDDLSPLAHTDPDSGELVVAPGREGEFIARIHHRIGKLKVLVPPVDRLQEAIWTTPDGAGL